MKKILSYAVAAILLGTVTMLAPTMLLGSIYYDPLATGYGKVVPRCPASFETNKGVGDYSLDTKESFGLTISPLSNILSAGLMLVPSFLLALSVYLYLRKRVF